MINRVRVEDGSPSALPSPRSHLFPEPQAVQQCVSVVRQVVEVPDKVHEGEELVQRCDQDLTHTDTHACTHKHNMHRSLNGASRREHRDVPRMRTDTTVVTRQWLPVVSNEGSSSGVGPRGGALVQRPHHQPLKYVTTTTRHRSRSQYVHAHTFGAMALFVPNTLRYTIYELRESESLRTPPRATHS